MTVTAPPSPLTPPTPPAPAPAPAPRHWWHRPWVGPLALVAVAFVVYSLPRYLSLDPARSLVPAPEGFPAHYPILVAHVLFGSIAMLTCCVQIWPRLRQRHPVLHRRTGRVYVFAGVLPAGALALIDGAVSPFGPMAVVSDVLLALLWLGCTLAGLRAARQRRFGDHRRWMIRSFALTLSIILNRLIGAVAVVVLQPQLGTTFGGSEVAFGQTVGGLSSWGGWVIALLVSQWWLDRHPTPARAR